MVCSFAQSYRVNGKQEITLMCIFLNKKQYMNKILDPPLTSETVIIWSEDINTDEFSFTAIVCEHGSTKLR